MIHARGLCLLPLLLGAEMPGQAEETSPPKAAAEAPVVAPAAAPTTGMKERTAAQMARMMRRSLVTIRQRGRDGVDGLGSGFVIPGEGLIATNLHVIGEARGLEVELGDGRRLEVVAVHATDAHWDLAVLRVVAKDLKPLPLGDSDVVEQGDRVVAMGNPQGLEFSVVEGVVSAVRELEIEDDLEVPMLQVAVPIEQGNSGGPVLNRWGEVVGLLTLKSMRTENLGFAMPVNALKRLLETPNPVPMSRWLTIGALDARQWQTVMGSRWSQHAGVIRAQTPGDGFGGRALCLAVEPVPAGPMEAAVSVKLDDESGAAGLAFCADGGDRHYGFYPSGGKLRLTRFDGPDVYSWTILADVEVPSYRDGEWNQLRVRVDDTTVTGWVNGVEVVKLDDQGLRGGRAGLCKFRDTEADFRQFRVGKDLAPKPLPPEVVVRVDGQIDQVLTDANRAREAARQLAEESVTARRRIAERRKRIEMQVRELRQLELAVHREDVTQQLKGELEKKSPDLLRAALLLARFDDARVNVADYSKRLQSLVDEVKPQLAAVTALPARVRLISQFLFEENGFHGSRHDYENRANSYINAVLEDREGLPITLSVVYLEVARRLGVKGVFGVGLPGRFMVGYRVGKAPGELRLVDVFNKGRSLTLSDAAEQLNAGVPFDAEMLEPASSRAILLRMIRNLLSSALEDADRAEAAVAYLDLYLEIEPDSPSERFARARLRQLGGDRPGAREDVAWLMKNSDDLPPAMHLQLQRWYQSLAE